MVLCAQERVTASKPGHPPPDEGEMPAALRMRRKVSRPTLISHAFRYAASLREDQAENGKPKSAGLVRAIFTICSLSARVNLGFRPLLGFRERRRERPSRLKVLIHLHTVVGWRPSSCVISGTLLPCAESMTMRSRVRRSAARSLSAKADLSSSYSRNDSVLAKSKNYRLLRPVKGHSKDSNNHEHGSKALQAPEFVFRIPNRWVCQTRANGSPNW